MRYAIGFLVASLVQAGIMLASESIGISALGARFTLMQLVIHLAVGQLAGFLLLLMLRNVRALQGASPTVVGTLYGLVIWAVVLDISSTIGAVNAPWSKGMLTTIASMAAFIAFGVIASDTIHRHMVRVQ